MKTLASALLIVSILLTGCVNNEKKDSGKGGLANLKPTDKPQNPASKEYVDHLTSVLSNSQKYVPEDAVIFDAVIDGFESKPIYSWSEERSKATAKLNNEGLRFADDIKTKCIINNAKSEKTGEAIRTGATLNQRIGLSTAGIACPYIVNKKNESLTVYNRVDANNNSISVTATVTGTNFLSNEVKEQRLASLAGVQSMVMSLNINATVNFSKDHVSQNMTVVSTGSGDMQIRLANGDVISGPIKAESNVNNSISESRVLWEGMTSQGAVRMFIISKNGSESEVYINGEKVDSKSIGSLGK